MTSEQLFECSLNPENGTIEISLHGFWTKQTAADFFAALLAAEALRRPFGGTPKYLCDVNGFNVQSRDISEYLSSTILRNQDGSAKIAVVATSALLKLQGSRLGEGQNLKFFDSEIEARNWLLD
jgi:hypothetical protein